MHTRKSFRFGKTQLAKEAIRSERQSAHGNIIFFNTFTFCILCRFLVCASEKYLYSIGRTNHYKFYLAKLLNMQMIIPGNDFFLHLVSTKIKPNNIKIGTSWRHLASCAHFESFSLQLRDDGGEF